MTRVLLAPFLIAALALPARGAPLPLSPSVAANAAASAPLADPTPVPAPAPASEGILDRVGGDLRDAAHAPAHLRFWGEVASGLVVIGAVSTTDNSLRDRIRSSDTPSRQKLAKDIRPLGELGGMGLMAAAWGIGAATDRPRLTLIGEDGLEATLLAAGILAPALKLAVGRSRPPQHGGSHDFLPFSGRSSFPSGESTEAFAIASVVATHSDSGWVKGTAYTLATAVAWGRMEADAHFASDVVAGALIGAGVGHWIAQRHQGLLGGDRHLMVMPTVGREGHGLMVGYTW